VSRLFDLLPAVHRVRDADRGSPLETLLDLIEREVLARQRDHADHLYDNWFIETCEDWVVPYIGDLLGVPGLGGARSGRRAQRGLVANTIAYRRRKGAAAVLEQLAFDVTGWTARAVEFFELLGWNQNLNHLRLDRGGTANVRDAGRAELADTPFDTFAHTADVRHVDVGRGRHNISNVGIFLWRLQSYPLQRTTAAGSGGRFTFDPLGRDTPLFNRPRAESAIDHLAEELNVEGPLRRRPLRDELRAGVPATADEDDGIERFLGPSGPAFQVFLDGTAVPPDELSICDLGDPARMATSTAVAVDPVRGRLALRPGDARVPETSWAYGFAGDLGGGPYDRRASVARALADAEAAVPSTWWQRGVLADKAAGETELDGDLLTALTAYADGDPKPLALIAMMDSRTYAGDPANDNSLTITVPPGCRLVVAAGDWPERQDPTSGLLVRRARDISALKARPLIAADITVVGGTGTGGADPGVLVLDGLVIDGTITVAPGALGGLRLAHCTVVPRGGNRLAVDEGGETDPKNIALTVELERSICGPIDVGGHIAGLRLVESIVDGDVSATDLEADRCTLLAGTSVRSVQASESILVGRVVAARRQTGCVRYSWLPLDSKVPRRFRCQPEDESGAVRPEFTSLTHGDPGYGQLGRATPDEIGRGAEDEGEMGVFNFLQNPRRLADLHTQLDQYLRLGLEAGTFFVT
jgi:hypothetical protein